MDSDHYIFGIARTGTGSIATLELPTALVLFGLYVFIIAAMVAFAVRVFGS